MNTLKVCLSLLLLSLVSANAQLHIPKTLNTSAVAMQIVNGSDVFDPVGAYLILPTKSGNNYNIVGMGGVAHSYGTYTYEPAAAPAALQMNDSETGPINTQLFFNATNYGSYITTSEIFPGVQVGNFTVFSSPALSKLAGQSVAINVSSGTYPFATNGVCIVNFPATGSNYTVLGSGTIQSSRGIYSYAVSNSAVGQITMSDSAVGSYKAYYAFQNFYTGLYVAVQDANYQTGTFMLLTTSKPTVTISNLKANQSISTINYNVSGKATDKIIVTKVYYSLNGSNWTLANGTSNWSASLYLHNGTNQFSVYSQDNSGNISPISTVPFKCTAH